MDSLFSIPTPSSVHIQEFKDLYKKRFNEDLSDSEVIQQLVSLLVVVKYQQIESRKKNIEEIKAQIVIKAKNKVQNDIDQLLREMRIEISMK